MSSAAEGIWVLGNEWLKDGNFPQAIREFKDKKELFGFL